MNALRQPFDDGRLAHARIAHEDGIVLGASNENLDHPVHFSPSTDHRIQVAARGGARHVAAVLGQRTLRATPAATARSPTAATHATGTVGRFDAAANRPEVDPGLAQALAGLSTMMGQHAQEQVFGADEPHAGALGFQRGGTERVPPARTKRSATGVVVVAGTQGLDQHHAQLQHVDLGLAQDARRRRLRRGQNRQQQMIRTHRRVPQVGRLDLRLGQDPPALGGQAPQVFNRFVFVSCRFHAASS